MTFLLFHILVNLEHGMSVCFSHDDFCLIGKFSLGSGCATVDKLVVIYYARGQKFKSSQKFFWQNIHSPFTYLIEKTKIMKRELWKAHFDK